VRCNGDKLVFVHTQLKGPIANIPALKNQKINGTNILRGESKALLALMSHLFQKSLQFQVPRFEIGELVFCVIFCAYRKNSFDEDNVATTVRDWLEPRHIRNKDRGWGIGLVDNDRFVQALAVKKAKTAKNPDLTEIFIVPLASILSARDAFLSHIVGPDIKEMY